MALTGLQIFKLLPNKNCGDCGVPTCLAFAMKLAAKTIEPEACPHISAEALATLGASQAPPIKSVSFSVNNQTITVGAETVMYRHEKTFVNQPVLVLAVSDQLTNSEFARKLEAIRTYAYERVGQTLYPEGIALVNHSGSPDTYLEKYKLLQSADKILVLSGCQPEYLKRILEIESNPARLLINAVTADSLAEWKNTLTNPEIKTVLEAGTLEDLFSLVAQAESLGLKNLMLKSPSSSPAVLLKHAVWLRRLAIQKNHAPAGYPVLAECRDESLGAITGICKYASLLILNTYSPESLFPLLTLRQNIYTDPQKPLQIQPGVYAIGEPGPDSPLLVTTNFSLTYFIVSGEIDNSPFAARLLLTDSEGMSVLTAWSANKFSPQLIAQGLNNSKLEQELQHKKIIIPGYVASLKGELEDELCGWTVLVGPQEAADIPLYLKETWNP